MRARWAGWPSRITMLLRPLASLARRLRKSRKTGPVKRCSKTRKRSVPVLEIAAIMLALKRLPVPLVTGVWPIGAHVRPALWSERRPDSSTQRISARWRRAAFSIAGLSDEVCVVVVTDSALVAGKDTDDHQDHL